MLTQEKRVGRSPEAQLSKAPELDTRRWPLVFMRFGATPTEAEYERLLDAHHAALLRRELHVVVTTSAKDVQFGAGLRRRAAEWIGHQEALLRKYSAGWAFVLPDAVQRGVLTAILWFRPLPSHHVVVATEAQAEAWARARLAEVDRHTRLALDSP